jgi:hypothetical protein
MCLAPEARLCRSKYPSLFVRKYGPTYRQLRLKLRRELRRQLNPALNLKLDLDINPSLNHALFTPLYRELDSSLFTSSDDALYRKKNRSLYGPVCLQLHRQLQLPRRPSPRRENCGGPTADYHIWYTCSWTRSRTSDIQHPASRFALFVLGAIGGSPLLSVSCLSCLRGESLPSRLHPRSSACIRGFFPPASNSAFWILVSEF